MEDPWGSPWASSDTTAPKHDPSPSPPKSFLSPPPKAFFGSNASNVPSQSPWADDDGLGDWAGSDQAESTGWGPWNDLGVHASQLTPRPDSTGKQSPIAWPSSAATSPGLKPTLRSRSSSVFRQHALDPWSADSSWNDLAVSLSPTRLNVEAPRPHDEDVAVASNEVIIQVNGPETSRDTAAGISGEKTLQDAGQKTSDLLPSKPCDLRDNGVEHESPSRPSSISSVESDHGADRQDSPITSIDEDPKSRPPYPSRKASRKVSELVGLYDGLTRAASEEPAGPEHSAPHQTKSPDGSNTQDHSLEDNDEADSRGYDSAVSDVEGVQKASTTSVSSGRSSTPRAKLRDDSGSEVDPGVITPKGTSVAVQQLINEFGAIKFTVDLKTIDELFARAPDDTEDNSGPGCDIPDRVITDSFTTVEERKTWYRVSRYGSMRNHNSGDEENYHRVNWKTCQLHTDTIKIVRRWMEEDSFSGKATLGGSKRTSVFNWDSSAAPIDLDTVFARKPAQTHARVGSIAPPKHAQYPSIDSSGSVTAPRKASGDSVSSLGQLRGNATPPAASFSWSSSAIDSIAATQPNTINGSGSKTSGLTSASHRTFDPIPPLPLSSKATQVPPPSRKQTNEHDSEDTDDDAWGEMISSPTQEPAIVTNSLWDNEKDAILAPNTTLAEFEVRHSFNHPQAATMTINSADSGIKATASEQSGRVLSIIPSDDPLSEEARRRAVSNTTAVSNVDPWASADFSVFDPPRVTPVPSAIDSLPTQVASLQSLQTSQVLLPQPPSSPKPQSHIHPSSSKGATTPTAKVTLGPLQTSQEEQEAKLVRQIIQNLPDLSYMIR
ncbi:hypothetical protein BJ170DRAFT_298590 [Xylariales sp. AK1849]|nr:hypothetical protein BJ170DRAFT_298590 [Xylariales sp. AK1849]